MSDPNRVSTPYGNYPGSGSTGSTTGETWREKASDVADQAKNLASEASDKASELGRTAADKANEVGRTAVDKLDSGRQSAANALSSAASSLRNTAQGNEGKLADYATSAADRLDSTANYMRTRDVRNMASDVEDLVRRNPGQSMVAALAVGFLLGAALRGGRDND